MRKVIELKKISNDRIRQQYELKDCDEDLVDLAAKLINCNPSGNALKKKEEFKADFLKRVKEDREKRIGDAEGIELSDEDLEAAAGGVKLPESEIPTNHKL